MAEALRDVEGEIALIGISNQGLCLPLMAAARPIRRIVLINAAIPRPGRSFMEASKKERVFASLPARVLARFSPGMSEVCPHKELPRVVRGRVGYAFNPWIFYVTGGLAWSQSRFLESPGVGNDEDKALRIRTGWALARISHAIFA
jgi:hypothetical protein